ncbi:hypothetical protein GQ42DRAFT_163863 [Ramicandelaber brevisporus]|nr:hypothetical protein GQ42DRAFT_163863 [Ramicandelaber brevisporus]
MKVSSILFLAGAACIASTSVVAAAAVPTLDAPRPQLLAMPRSFDDTAVRAAAPPVVAAPAKFNVDAATGQPAPQHAQLALAAHRAGIDLSKAPIVFDKFVAAIRSIGLPHPSVQDFIDFLNTLRGPDGRFVVGPGEAILKLLKAVLKGTFGYVSQHPEVILNIISVISRAIAGTL